MWELISANKRKSAVITIIMFGFMLGLGYLIGFMFDQKVGGYYGMMAAATIWFIQLAVAISSGGKVFLAGSGAIEIGKEDYPQLYNVVEEMVVASSLPAMPKIYVIPREDMNAFATGTKPENACVAVTSGLLKRLNRDELQGVIAHEVSHILNRDVMYMTYAAIMLGTIVALAMALRLISRFGMFTGGGRSRSRSSNDGGGAVILLVMLVGFLVSLLAPFFAQLLYFAISRKREYLADASAARLTRYPEGLASALEKISLGTGHEVEVNKVMEPMYIYNPSEARAFSALGSTHPKTEDRIRVLRNMSHGASYKDYQSSYNTVMGKKKSIIPGSELKDDSVPLRSGASFEPQAKSPKQQKIDARQVGDMILLANSFRFINCGCGVRLKVPPNYTKETLKCPKCGTMHHTSQVAEKKE
ncbi:MAG: M48 family metallopeptidase [Phycisphaerae bacterium]